MAHPGGRPLKFQTVEELERKCEEYFESCWEIDEKTGKRTQVEPYLITGLALHLKTTRQCLINYADRPEFLDTIIAAKQRCESYAEKVLIAGKNQTGAIFALKNYGWRDERQIEINDVTKLSEEEIESKLSKLLGKA